MGRPFREKISTHILSLRSFPIVPMNIHLDHCIAGLLNDPIIFKAKSFFESSEVLSDLP